MKKILSIIFAAAMALLATSCLEHKALGLFSADLQPVPNPDGPDKLYEYPENVQLNYGFQYAMQFWNNQAGVVPVPGGEGAVTLEPTDDDIHRFFGGVQALYVYAFPRKGNPDMKDYNFPLDDDKNYKGAFLPIFTDGPSQIEHFRGRYDFLVCSEDIFGPDPTTMGPVHKDFHDFLNYEAGETTDATSPLENDYYFGGVITPLKLELSSLPDKMGFPYVKDFVNVPNYAFGGVENELVPGSDQENQTHNVPVELRKLAPNYDRFSAPEIRFPSAMARQGWEFVKSETCSTRVMYYAVTGIAKTWKIASNKPGKPFTQVGTTDGYDNPDGYYQYFDVLNFGQSPNAGKVEVYLIYLVSGPIGDHTLTMLDYGYFMCYRKVDVTGKLGKRTGDIVLGESFEWNHDFSSDTPWFTNSNPTPSAEIHWIEIK